MMVSMVSILIASPKASVHSLVGWAAATIATNTYRHRDAG
jgi:hypothetical protein